MSQWTLFSNHGHVLLLIAKAPEARLRDVAAEVGITERAVQKIVKDLQEGGMITVTKQGRRNRYRVQYRKALRHPLESHRSVGDLVRMVHGELTGRRSPDSGVTGSGTGPVSDQDAQRPAQSGPQTRAAAIIPPEPPQDAVEPEPETQTVEGPVEEPAEAQTDEAKPEETPPAPPRRKRPKKKKSTDDDSQGSLF